VLRGLILTLLHARESYLILPVTRGSTVHSDFTKVGGVSNIVFLCTIFG